MWEHYSLVGEYLSMPIKHGRCAIILQLSICDFFLFRIFNQKFNSNSIFFKYFINLEGKQTFSVIANYVSIKPYLETLVSPALVVTVKIREQNNKIQTMGLGFALGLKKSVYSISKGIVRT